MSGGVIDARGAAALRKPRVAMPGALLRRSPDERLVALVRTGEDRAFEAIYDRYHRNILSFCRHMLGSREEAEDAVQHTFFAAYRHLGATDRDIQLRAWLYTIARNRCLSVLRARREQATDTEDAAPATDGLAAAVERRQDLRDLLADLARLPEDQRAALVLAEIGAVPHAEIADVIGVPRDKVKALVFQARSSLTASRTARETPCHEIREELSTATGAALRRANLKHHLRGCPACREYRAEVDRQRKAMAILLPVAPTAGLKLATLAGLFGAGKGGMGGGAAAAAATAGGAAGGTAGTLLLGGSGGAALKLLTFAALAGTGVFGGYEAVKKHPTGHDVAGGKAHAKAEHGHHVSAGGAADAVTAAASPPVASAASGRVLVAKAPAAGLRDVVAHRHGAHRAPAVAHWHGASRYGHVRGRGRGHGRGHGHGGGLGPERHVRPHPDQPAPPAALSVPTGPKRVVRNPALQNGSLPAQSRGHGHAYGRSGGHGHGHGHGHTHAPSRHAAPQQTAPPPPKRVTRPASSAPAPSTPAAPQHGHGNAGRGHERAHAHHAPSAPPPSAPAAPQAPPAAPKVVSRHSESTAGPSQSQGHGGGSHGHGHGRGHGRH